MKTTTTILSLISALLIVVLSGFVGSRVLDKPFNDEEMPVDPFNKISISIPADVHLDQGSPQNLVIEADPSTLEKIKATVNDNQLVIKLREPGQRLKGDVTIHITVPELENLSVAGSATVTAKRLFKAGELTLRLAGSGDIEFADLQSGELDARISGSGKITLSGQTREFDVALAGSGDIDAFDFVTSGFDGKISGSGSCNVNVTGELGATIAGSGDIMYRGTPKVSSMVAGSGSIRPEK
ncbi:MAG TPA: head GIN domain-containing protein [Bacteroidales bacterium]|nr:head GIN domain-containing protein [Bacteroidales bacterium]